jgi:hypothetical protein
MKRSWCNENDESWKHSRRNQILRHVCNEK